jgi:hypothetical protein
MKLGSWALTGVLAMSLAGCDDSGDDGGSDSTTDSAATDTADTADASSGEATTADSSGETAGAVGMGTISVTGSVDGEPFSIDCTQQTIYLSSLNNKYDWLCQMGGENATITGSVTQMNIQGTTFEVGTTMLEPGVGIAISVARAGDFKNLATSLAESGGLTLEMEAVDESTFVGSFSGSWVQEGITVEMDGAFNFPVTVS